jgi:hypothetical protein
MQTTTTKATHLDFSRAPLTVAQLAWLAAQRIESKRGDRGYGFYFFRGERWIEPVAATDRDVVVMEIDRHEDGDGAKVVRTFPRLRDALRFLAA